MRCQFVFKTNIVLLKSTQEVCIIQWTSEALGERGFIVLCKCVCGVTSVLEKSITGPFSTNSKEPLISKGESIEGALCQLPTYQVPSKQFTPQKKLNSMCQN